MKQVKPQMPANNMGHMPEVSTPNLVAGHRPLGSAQVQAVAAAAAAKRKSQMPGAPPSQADANANMPQQPQQPPPGYSRGGKVKC